MKAVALTRFGDPDSLQVADIPKPAPDAGQCLVRVTAAGVNFSETLMRQNRYPLTPPLPSILGSECVGIVESVGEGGDPSMIGRRFLAPLFAAGVHFGGYAEYVVIETRWAMALPEAISDGAALALAVQGLSALHIARRSDPRGKSVLITAAAGGVGSMLVQLARHMGARQVIATASTAEKRHFCLDLGADTAIDYTVPDWTSTVLAQTAGSGPEIVYESTGGDITRDSLEILASGGEIVIYGALNVLDFAMGIPQLRRLIFRNQSLTGFALAPLLTPEGIKADLAFLFGLVQSGDLGIHIGGIFPLAQAAEAHRALEQRGTTGKVLLMP